MLYLQFFQIGRPTPFIESQDLGNLLTPEQHWCGTQCMSQGKLSAPLFYCLAPHSPKFSAAAVGCSKSMQMCTSADFRLWLQGYAFALGTALEQNLLGGPSAHGHWKSIGSLQLLVLWREDAEAHSSQFLRIHRGAEPSCPLGWPGQ